MSEISWITGPLSWKAIIGYRDYPSRMRHLTRSDGLMVQGAYVDCSTPLEDIKGWITENVSGVFSIHAVVTEVTHKFRIDRAINGMLFMFEDDDEHVMFKLRF